jgi:hypothetical protein
LRRIVIIGTAVAVLVGASAAYAAFNTYTAGFTFSPSKAGTAKKPVPVAFTENLGAAGPTGDRAAILTNIKTTIYGLKSDGKDFPKCSNAIISTSPTFNAGCPKGSLVARGVVHALIGPSANPSKSAGLTCNPGLMVYNGGQGHLIFFFTASSPTQCAGLKTGATAPYDATYTRQGNNLVTNVPLPADISSAVAGHPGLYGSLIGETLNFIKTTKRVHGKTVASTESLGCKAGKRAWAVQYTATLYNGGGSETQTVHGSARCS